MDRTGVGTRAVFGAQLRFDLAGGAMPLLTTKRVFWKTATRELLWFLTGETNIRPLCAQGVEIWTDWPLARYRRETGEEIARADFSRRIVADADFAARWGDLGPVYGKQWVDWPVYEPAGDGTFHKRAQGVNQVAQVVESLRSNPGSRRHIIEGWNVAELDLMALPPCHKSYQFHVAGQPAVGAALPAQLRSRARLRLQHVVAGAADADAGAAVRSRAGRGGVDGG